MRRRTSKEVLVSDTFKVTFISSGSVAASIACKIYDGAENEVTSVSVANSGNGHYYGFALVNTAGWYVTRWTATINARQYQRSRRFKAVLNEVD